MTSPYRRLGEGLAAKQPPAKDAVQTDPRALKQWIAALPMANAGATARLLYQALRDTILAMSDRRLETERKLASTVRRLDELREELESEMRRASAALEFEKAASARDRLFRLRQQAFGADGHDASASPDVTD